SGSLLSATASPKDVTAPVRCSTSMVSSGMCGAPVLTRIGFDLGGDGEQRERRWVVAREDDPRIHRKIPVELDVFLAREQRHGRIHWISDRPERHGSEVGLV